MISAIFITLILATALTAPTTVEYEDGLVKYNMDTNEDSPIGLQLSGVLDVHNEDKATKISAFLRIFKELIPLVESLEKETALEYTN